MTSLDSGTEYPRVRKNKVGESFGKAATYFVALFYVFLGAYYLSDFRFNVLALGTILSFAVLLSVFEVLSVKKTATRAQVWTASIRSVSLFGVLVTDTLTAFQGTSYVELSLFIIPFLFSYEFVHRREYWSYPTQQTRP